MKKIAFYLIICLCIARAAVAQTTITVFDTVLFYDGYAAKVDSPKSQPGVLRHRNDLYARKLTDAELQSIGSELKMKVIINAACDNYDRIGNVNLALVPKGDTAYHPDSVERIEIARYITPFMNKNVPPNMTPYEYEINNVADLLKETSLTANHDIWVELELFGVPYAAQTQIQGCAGRIDVFYGTLQFITNTPAAPQSDNVLIPLSIRKDLKNYDSTATDTIWKTSRTIHFNVPVNLTDAAFFLITSNHGANQNGEEYNRRNHFVYFDNDLKLMYKPGRKTCEPFRKYNTQGNGIYGPQPRDSAMWQSFSNWCPGDVIDTRVIALGAVSAGNHSFRLTVPDAVFANKEGYFPVSLYLQGKTSGTVGIENIALDNDVTVYPNPANDILNIYSDDALNAAVLTDIMGRKVADSHTVINGIISLNTGQLPAGIYTLRIYGTDKMITKKVQVAH